GINQSFADAFTGNQNFLCSECVGDDFNCQGAAENRVASLAAQSGDCLLVSQSLVAKQFHDFRKPGARQHITVDPCNRILALAGVVFREVSNRASDSDELVPVPKPPQRHVVESALDILAERSYFLFRRRVLTQVPLTQSQRTQWQAPGQA